MCTLSTQPSSAGLGQTLASQMTAAHQFMTAIPGTASFAAYCGNAACLASTYQFAGPPSYAPDASLASTQHANYARTFADSIRPHFDRRVREEIIAARAPSSTRSSSDKSVREEVMAAIAPLEAYQKSGLADIEIPDMFSAGILSADVAIELSYKISIGAVENLRYRASWDNHFLSRVFSCLLAAGLLVTMIGIPPTHATLLFVAAVMLIEPLGKWLFDNAKWGENAKLMAMGRRAINDQAMLAGPKQREQPLITTTDQTSR